MFHKIRNLFGLILPAGLVVAAIVLAVPAMASTSSLTLPQSRTSQATGSVSSQSCAPNWTVVPSTNPHIHNHLLAIEPVADNDAWAVGYYYESTAGQAPDTALIMHWDGAQWSEYALPAPIVGRLNGISAVSANDIWAAGWTNGDPNPDTNTLIMHWNGTAWSRVSSPTIEGISELNDVVALAPDNAWAVGSVNGTHGTLVEHWNGGYWAIVTSPPQSFGDNYILKEVSAVSANDIWAAGLVDQGSGFQRTLVEHWNGSQWSIVASPSPGSYYSRLDGITAIAANDVWAAGSYSNASGSDPDMTLIEHWDGVQWSVVSSPSPGIFYNALEDISASAADDIWAVGMASDNLQLPDYTVIEHWDGTSWSVVSSPNSSEPDSSLWGVTARNGTVWAVGKGEHKYDNNQPWVTLVLKQQCPPSPTPTGTQPTATRTATPLPSATPTACSLANTNYAITQTTSATIIPATTDIGLHCDNCKTTIALPFGFSLYGRVFSQAIIGSNGTLGFVANSNTNRTACLPSQEFDYAILAYWQELHLSNVAGGCPNCGIFTSVEGTAPNRIFNIEWRAEDYFYTSFVNVELRLYETSAGEQFDVIYGQVPSGTNQQVTVGVQKERGLLYTQFVCQNQEALLTNSTKLVFARPVCENTPTVVSSATSTRTGSPTPVPTGTSVAGTSTAEPTGTTVPNTTTAVATTTPGSTTATPSATVCSVAFSDVAPGSTFYSYVECLACRGIISGYPDGTFRPSNNVTRGQAAKILANAAGYSEAIPADRQTFQDVATGSTFWVYVERVALHGAISGYPCGGAGEPCPGAYYRPQNNMSRGQLAKVATGTAGFSDTIPPARQSFNDVPATSPFWVYIERAALHSVISGYDCGRPGEPCPGTYFRPGNDVTRGQTAKIVSNTFFPGCATQGLQ